MNDFSNPTFEQQLTGIIGCALLNAGYSGMKDVANPLTVETVEKIKALYGAVLPKAGETDEY